MELFHTRFTEAKPVMRCSFKPVINHVNKDGTGAIFLQVILERKRALFPTGFAVPAKCLQKDGVRNHPDSALINLAIESIRSKASRIILEHTVNERHLTVEMLREEMRSTYNRSDFMVFARHELELRRSSISPSTYDQNCYALDKLQSFKKVIPFSNLSVTMVQEYQKHERKTGNQENTINKTLTTWKVYLNAAKRKGLKFNNPFDHVKIKKVKPSKTALTFEEFTILYKYFQSPTAPAHHKHTLRYFLFCCCNGIRISDITTLRWNNVNGNTLRITPKKTKQLQKVVSIPLTEFELSLLPPCTNPAATIFDCYADPVTNRILKEIAKAEDCKIKKNLTFHMSRHTFATLFLERGGRVEVLKELMGHSDIDTTMVYVHMTDKHKTSQKKEAFDNMFPTT